MIIGIIITNYGLQYVFKLLSNFEKHQSLSSESSSRVIKIFVAQVLNTVSYPFLFEKQFIWILFSFHLFSYLKLMLLGTYYSLC